jgi:hypothetical protein
MDPFQQSNGGTTIATTDAPTLEFHRYMCTIPWKTAQRTIILPGQMWNRWRPPKSKGVWRDTEIRKNDMVHSAMWPKLLPNSTTGSSTKRLLVLLLDMVLKMQPSTSLQCPLSVTTTWMHTCMMMTLSARTFSPISWHVAHDLDSLTYLSKWSKRDWAKPAWYPWVYLS